MSDRQVILVVPDDADIVSGGNLYNRSLGRALERSGSARVVFAAEAIARAAGQPALFVIDRVLLEVVPELRAGNANHIVMVLAHYLTTLDPTCETPDAHERDCVAAADGLVATSQWAARALRDAWPAKPVVVVPPALVVTPRGVRPSGAGFRALMATSLIRCKGVLEFLTELAKLDLPQTEWSIAIIGRADFEPDYAAACRAAVDSDARLAAAIEFHGAVEPDELARRFEQSSALISSAEFETFGMAVREARAFGLPVIARRGGNVPAHLPNEDDGILCEDATVLAATCVELMRDADRLTALRRHAWHSRPRIDYSWDDAAASLLAQLREGGSADR